MVSFLLICVDFSLSAKAQNDNGDFFAAACALQSVWSFMLTHSAQNDKVRCHCATNAFYPSLQALNTQKFTHGLKFKALFRKIPQSLFA